MTYDELFKEFVDNHPEFKSRTIDYKPWGKTSIVIWCSDGHAYKCKYHGPDRFIIQEVSEDDINRKLGKV